jgi:hypothetical protein
MMDSGDNLIIGTANYNFFGQWKEINNTRIDNISIMNSPFKFKLNQIDRFPVRLLC